MRIDANINMYALRREPFTHVARLDILRRSRDERYLSWRLFLGVLIEYGLALLLQPAEQYLLHLLQKVESSHGSFR